MGFDGGFGVGGIVSTDLGGSSDYVHGLAATWDGKLLISGTTHAATNDLAVARYHAGMAQRVYYQNDAQFNVTSLSNEAGQIVERYQQTPYGQRTVLNADWTLDADGVSDYANALGHQGLLHDFETGLVYNRARYLHVTLGVFTAPDPLGHVDGMNLYQYVRSAPTSLVDPSGLDPAVDDLTDPYGRWIGHDDVGADGWVPGIGKLSRDALIAHLHARGLRDPWKILQELERGDPAWAERVHKLAELKRIEQLLVKYADSSLWWMTTMGGAAGRGRVAPGRCVGKVRGPSKAIHKNSLDYVGDTHVYRVKGPDGTTYKIGESAQGVRVMDGASIRAEQRVRQLMKEMGQTYHSEIVRWFPDKAAAREYETRLIEKFRRMFGQDALPGNKTNR